MSFSPAAAGAAPVVRTPVRVGVVGLGYWGRKLAARYSSLPAAWLVGVCDIDPGARAAAARELGAVPCDATLPQLLRRHPDLIVVATPPHAHVSVAVEALDAGCAVFIEKPVATTVADIDHLQAVAKRAGKSVMGSALWSWDPTIDTLARTIARGDLGRLLRIEGARQNLGCIKPGHDVIDDLLPHDLQVIARVHSAAPATVQAWGSRLARTPALDTVTVRLDWQDGLEAELRLSWVAPHKQRRMTFVGERAMVVYDPVVTHTPLSVHTVTPQDAVRPEPWPSPPFTVPPLSNHTLEPLLSQCQETLDCMAGAAPRVPIGVHRTIAAIIEATRASVSQQGERVFLPDFPGALR